MESIKPVLKIRTDGSSEIGLGHVVRCTSLAHMLENDFSIHFFTKEIPKSLNSEITHNGWDVTVIENETNFFNKLKGDEIVVLDGYQFESEYQKQINEKGSKLVCIDDFHNQYFYADLVINHAPGVTKEDYEGETYTKYLLGPDYALLRPEFLVSRPRETDNSDDIKNIFICFGGSDSKNLTAKILSWLPTEGYSVIVVLGNAYPHRDKLNEVIEERQGLNIVVKNSLSAKQMRQELVQADLAVVPASGVSLEALVVGVPSIIGYYTPNQAAMYKGIVKNKGFYDAFDFSRDKFISALKLASEDYQRPNDVNPVDIKKRINEEFSKLRSQMDLKIREVSNEDIDDLYKWANDPNSRKNSYNQEKIDYSSHVKWVRNKLSSSNCVFLIFENAQDQKIGFVRFDRDDQETWVISINVAPSQRGMGFSVEMLRKAISYFTNKRSEVAIKAFIKKENLASIKAFDRAGFEVLKEVNIKGDKSILMIWK